MSEQPKAKLDKPNPRNDSRTTVIGGILIMAILVLALIISYLSVYVKGIRYCLLGLIIVPFPPLVICIGSYVSSRIRNDTNTLRRKSSRSTSHRKYRSLTSATNRSAGEGNASHTNSVSECASKNQGSTQTPSATPPTDSQSPLAPSEKHGIWETYWHRLIVEVNIGPISRNASGAAILSLIPSVAIWGRFIGLDQHITTNLESNNETVKGAALQAEAAMVGSVITLLTVMIAGLSIMYSAFSIAEQRKAAEDQRERERNDAEAQRTLELKRDRAQRKQAETQRTLELKRDRDQRAHAEILHQEMYNKDLLQQFNDNPDVENGKIILEAISRKSIYLPVLHLKLYHDPKMINDARTKARAKLDAAQLYYPNNGRQPYNPSGVEVETGQNSTRVYTGGEDVEVIPTLQDLNTALTPDKGDAKLPLMGIKICYSFDAFLEAYVTVGKLQIDFLKRKEKEERQESEKVPGQNSPNEPISLLRNDIEIWWNAIDLPYWSRLMLWGTDEAVEKAENKNTPTHTVKDYICLAKKSDKGVIVEWVDEDKKMELLEHWDEICFDYTSLIDATDASGKDYGKATRIMMRKYINEYYPEALKIAFVLVLAELEPEDKEAVKAWIQVGHENKSQTH